MRELFIYYRIRADAARTALAAAQAMQARLREEHPGLTARLLRRPDNQDQQQTWMEIYTSPAGVTPDLEARIEEAAAALAPFVVGTRHTEAFIPCAS
jgi:hypothetical protein